MIRIFLFMTFFFSFAAHAHEKASPGASPAEAAKIIHQRLPNNLNLQGSYQGQYCSVHLKYTSKKRASEALVRTDLRVFILNDYGRINTFLGSWHWQGGRGGCASVPLNYRDYLYFRQDGGTKGPCWASPPKVFGYDGDFKVQVIHGKTVFSVRRDDQFEPSICVVDRGDILLPPKK